MGKSYYMQECCSDFLKATESGTDNEGYGALFNLNWPDLDGWHCGASDLEDAAFCPWCGKELPKVEAKP